MEMTYNADEIEVRISGSESEVARMWNLIHSESESRDEWIEIYKTMRIPDGYKWIATDGNAGEVWVYVNKPSIRDGYFNGTNGSNYAFITNIDITGLDWTESLREIKDL